jgi:hypothetical protein
MLRRADDSGQAFLAISIFGEPEGPLAAYICVPLGEIAPARLADVEGGYQGMMSVGSLVVLLSGLTSPPPKTVAVLVTLAGALVATLTVMLIGG